MARRKSTGLEESQRSANDTSIDPAFEKFRSELMVEAWRNTPSGKKASRIIKQQRIETSKLAMLALIQRYPENEPIDVEQLVNNSLAIGKSMLVGFVEEKLI